MTYNINNDREFSLHLCCFLYTFFLVALCLERFSFWKYRRDLNISVGISYIGKEFLVRFIRTCSQMENYILARY